MANLQYQLVLKGKRTCNKENKTVRQVSSSVYDEVVFLLKENGYDLDGKKKR